MYQLSIALYAYALQTWYIWHRWCRSPSNTLDPVFGYVEDDSGAVGPGPVAVERSISAGLR